MSTEPNFTNTIEEWTHFFIPLADGIQLAARAWLPTDAIEYPVPAILEYIPYRKSPNQRNKCPTPIASAGRFDDSSRCENRAGARC